METRVLALDDRTYAEFRTYVQELTGISYTDAKRYLLEGRIKRRMGEIGLSDGRSYLHFLRTDPRGKDEVESLIDQVSIHETSFFRHPRQFEILRDVLAELVEARRARGPRRLRLWSAACSSGEEAFTAAMVVHDLVPAGDWRVEVFGTDISTAVLNKARAGRFARRTGTAMPEAYARYLTADPAHDDVLCLAPEIHRMVSFSVVSLVDEARTRAMRDLDVILCRNVLIYFDQETKQKVLASLHDCLTPGGYLVLGPADSLHGLSSPLQRTPHSVYNFYRRALASPRPASRAAVAAASPAAPAAGPRPAAGRPVPPTLSATDTFRLKLLVNRIDLGLKNLNQELQDALVKSVDALGVISQAVDGAAQNGQCPRPVERELSRVSWQITRILQWLEVGDRTGQKVEATRAYLQELSDRLLGADQEAPDLRVNTGAFDHTILPTEAEAEEHQGAMSQDDIDKLFG